MRDRRDGVVLKALATVVAMSCVPLLAETGARDAAAGDMTHFMTVTLHGDYVAEGVGLLGKSEGTIVVDTIPEGAELVGGVLYWALLDRSGSVHHRFIRIDGMRVEGELLGVAGPFVGGLSSYAYRAVVSADDLLSGEVKPVGGPLPPVPSGNGTYVLSGFPTEEPTQMQGATLVLVYGHEALRARDVVFWDGNVRPYIAPPPPFAYDTRQDLSGFVAENPTEARTTFVVGHGYPRGHDGAAFRDARGRVRFGPANPFRGRDGFFWDTLDLDLNGLVVAGDTGGGAIVRVIASPGGGGLYWFDRLIWCAQLLSVTTSNPVDPDPSLYFQN